MNKIRIKTFELLHQVLNMKFNTNDNNKLLLNDDGITYIAYDGTTGSIQVYITNEHTLPEGEYYYLVPPEELFKYNNDEYIQKHVTINNVTYIQYITVEQYKKEKDTIPKERIRYYE